MPKKHSSTGRKTRRGTPAAKRPKSKSKPAPARATAAKSGQRDSEGDLDVFDFADLEVDAVNNQKRTPVLIKMEPEVLAFFKAGGRGYQTRINRVLRFYVEDVRRASARRDATSS